MILDDLLKLSDAQASTISAASTSYVDTQAGGDSYEGAFMYVRVDTAFTAGAGDPYAIFSIQTADDTAFTTNLETLCQTGTANAANLTSGTEFKVRIPGRARRYIRGYTTIAGVGGAAISDTQKFSAGKWDQFIVKDTDLERQVAIS